MEHSFNIILANDYGILPALILKHFDFWLSGHKAKNDQYYFHDGKYWAYESPRSLAIKYSYFTPEQIRHAINKLRGKESRGKSSTRKTSRRKEKGNALITALSETTFLEKNAYLWYTFTDEFLGHYGWWLEYCYGKEIYLHPDKRQSDGCGKFTRVNKEGGGKFTTPTLESPVNLPEGVGKFTGDLILDQSFSDHSDSDPSNTQNLKKFQDGNGQKRQFSPEAVAMLPGASEHDIIRRTRTYYEGKVLYESMEKQYAQTLMLTALSEAFRRPVTIEEVREA